MSREVTTGLAPEKRTLLRFRGPDAERYLNGQISQDVRAIDQVRAQPACVTDAKGKLQFYVRVFRQADDLLVEGPFEQREELLARLERYLIADDAEIVDESDDYVLTHLISDASEVPGELLVRENARIAPKGWDVWSPAEKVYEAQVLLSPEAAEDSRIRSRIPAWGSELFAGLLPPEAGLDKTAISYRKGCYIGQEVLSRMKTAGKLNRKLAALAVPEGVSVGDLATVGGDSPALLKITSVSGTKDGESGLLSALGYVPKALFEEGEVAVDSGVVRILGWV